MSTMREVFESIDEAMFRGMGGGKASSDARAKMDKERAAKRKAGYGWRKDPKRDRGGSETLYNASQDSVAWVSWEDEKDVTPFMVRVINPDGGRGATKAIGSGFATLEKAKSAVMKELGL